MQYALGLNDKQFYSTPFEKLEQFAYAKGEEVIIARGDHAEAVAAGINQAFSDEAVLAAYREELLDLVVTRRKLTPEEILTINEQAAQTLKNSQ